MTTTFSEAYAPPSTKKPPLYLLNTSLSGYSKNNLNNDMKSYYFKRQESVEDRISTEYRRSYSRGRVIREPLSQKI